MLASQSAPLPALELRMVVAQGGEGSAFPDSQDGSDDAVLTANPKRNSEPASRVGVFVSEGPSSDLSSQYVLRPLYTERSQVARGLVAVIETPCRKADETMLIAANAHFTV